MKLLKAFLTINRQPLGSCLTIKRFVSDFNFDGKQEILENYLDNILMIGINLPDSKNMLTESALSQFIDTLERFYNNDEFRVAILHGIGGNFCSGIVSTENALKNSYKIIETLDKGEKPIIASLNGRIFDFGFQLAVMCDMKIIEKTSVIDINSKNQSTDIPDIVCQRLAMTTGLSKAMEIIVNREKLNSNTFNTTLSGFVNRVVETGCAFGQAVAWAQNTAAMPLKAIVEHKAKVYSILCDTANKRH